MKILQIGNKRIGDGEPCFIIAEAGVNHNGDIGRAKKMVRAAADAGADAVKFQTFSAERIASKGAGKARYQKETTDASESQYDMLKKLELAPADFHALSSCAEKNGIIFLSSPFDCGSVDLLEEVGVGAYKVPSGEITNAPLLSRIARTGKPVILSSGMADLTEIGDAVSVLRTGGAGGIVLLHCVTSYPAPIESLNLKVMNTLRIRFRIPVGFSDHTQGILAPVIARALGACVIEKHFTLKRTLPGPDHAASLEPGELARMVREVRTVDLALGDGRKRIHPVEREIRKVARKSLVAGSDIPKGSEITMEMIEVKRPGTGIAPADLSQVIGRKTRQRIRKDTVLRWEHFA